MDCSFLSINSRCALFRLVVTSGPLAHLFRWRLLDREMQSFSRLVTRGDAKIDYRRYARAREEDNPNSRHLPSPGGREIVPGSVADPSLSSNRHTQPRPSRRTFRAPIECSARSWFDRCHFFTRPPTSSGLHHSVSLAVEASPSCAAKQNLAPRCNGPPRAGPRQRRRRSFKSAI